MNSKIVEQKIKDILNEEQDLIQENANTDGKSPMVKMGLIAVETSKGYAERLLDEDVLQAFEE